MRVFGKILLFGEYAILEGGNALSVPSTQHFGSLKLGADTKDQLESHFHLFGFSEFLEKNFSAHINTAQLESDLHQRLYFDSNIPLGYGVGSSGAVLAAVLKNYGKNIPETLAEKKSLFGSIESYFHGQSSGLDVMVCYEHAPVLIENSKLKIAHSVHENDYAKFELIDTKEIGLTSELVKEFKGQNLGFKEAFKKVYVESTNHAIDYFLMGKKALMFEQMKKLSCFTYEYMPWTIPDSFKNQWDNSLNDENRVMKLCGSGGGGFVISYSIGHYAEPSTLH